MLEIGLTQAGFEVRSAVDGPDGLSVVGDQTPDCIVLDIMMPKIDGLSLIKLLRRLTEVPIIMLTARGDVRDRIDGLKAGADDYLAKPLEIEELEARIETALRRPMLRPVNGRIELSAREFDLLTTLARRPRRVFTRDELLDMVWGEERDITAGALETYIS